MITKHLTVPILPMRTFYKTWMAHKNRVHIETIETINNRVSLMTVFYYFFV